MLFWLHELSFLLFRETPANKAPTGYFRVVLAIASLYYMPLHPRTCSLLYSISCLLDALDGYAARYFNQSTTFGAVLDMVTDRCTTSCLLVFLSSAWPRWAIVFQGLICLDLASHYMHMYATLSRGGSNESHKNVKATQSWLLYQYYHSKVCEINSAPGKFHSILMFGNRRLFCLFAVLLTSFSSSAFTCYPSLRRPYRLRSCSQSLTRSLLPSNLVTRPTLFHPACLLVPGVPELSSWLVQTRWTASDLGLSRPFRSQSCSSSRWSMLSSL